MEPKIQELLDKIAAAAGVVGENAARGARMAGKKAGQFWDAGKARVRIMELKGDEAYLYQDLGKIMYAVHKGENATLGDIETKIAALDCIRGELADLESAGKNKKKCASCGRVLDEEDSFCRHCGAAADTRTDGGEDSPTALLTEDAGDIDDLLGEDK